MIQLHDVSLVFGGEPVFEDVSWTITPGARIGLVGPNGAGKTTLLRLIADDLAPSSGEVASTGTKVGYLRQGVQETATGRTVREEALRAFEDVLDLERKEERITEALGEEDHRSERHEKLLHQLDRTQRRLNALEAHRVRPRAEAVLGGLGFATGDFDRPLASFSGGWRMRAHLARLLLGDPDVLLLDEPTNHLDIDAIAWFEQYLREYDGTVVIVSHDRYFLDRMVTSVAEMSRGRLSTYDGNYSYYLDEREERRKRQQAAYENQQRKIKEIQRFIDKFRYNASKAAQVQSRIKKLEKMDRIQPPPAPQDTVHFEFPEPPRSGRVVLDLSRFSKTYETEGDPLPVFEDADPLAVERGDKIALIGPNGAGKSTLARILRGTEAFEGEREEGHKVQTTFFAQHQAEALDPEKTIFETLREAAPKRPATELRSLAGAFLFSGEEVRKKTRSLSGGEKSRVALARTLLKPANFLILDEPTNHLDIRSRGVLEEALQQYPGTFVIVSHDRHFLDEVANRIWRVGNGGVDDYPGTYAEYRKHREERAPSDDRSQGASDSSDESETASPSEQQSSPPSTNGASSNDGSFANLNSYQLRRKYEATEEAILEKENRQEELEAALADPSLYDDPGEAEDVRERYEAVKADLSSLYDEWEQLAEHVAEEA